MSPYKECIISISQSDPQFQVLLLWELCLHPIHRNTCVLRSKRSSNSCTWYLLFNHWIKSYVIVFKDERSHFKLIFCRIFLSTCWFNLIDNASNPSRWGILGYNPNKSAVTSSSFWGTQPSSLSFFKESLGLLRKTLLNVLWVSDGNPSSLTFFLWVCFS